MSEDSKPKVKVKLKKAIGIKSRQIGTVGLKTSSNYVDEVSQKDLSFPQLPYTIDEMKRDPAFAQPLDVSKTFRVNCLTQAVFENDRSSASKALAEYANYLIHNMQDLTWFEACQNICSDIETGFSLNEINASRAKQGPYKGNLVIDSLGPRAPKSLYAWVWDEHQRKPTHFIQNPLPHTNYFTEGVRKGSSYVTAPLSIANYNTNISLYNKYPLISLQETLHMKYNPCNSNPQGTPPAIAAFGPWQEKQIIQNYQVIGITRGLGGVPVVRVDDELLERANDPEGRYPEDTAALRGIERDAANTHAGKNAFFMLPSSLVDGSNSVYKYDIKLLGVDGSSGQFDISEIVKLKKTEIYGAFSMGQLLLGQDGNTSSYNMSTAANSVSGSLVHRDLTNYAAQIERMIKTILDADTSLKGKYDYRDLPKLKWKEFDELSMDDFGKGVMRMASGDKLTPAIMKHMATKAGYPIEGIDDLDFTSHGTSEVGTSMGTSGNGSNAQNNTDTNAQNKSLRKAVKHLIKDKQGNILDTKTGDLFTGEED